jgi:hypothetical protein
MSPTINRIQAGKYVAKHHGFVFTIENNSASVWTINNHAGIELYRDTSKKALINMLTNCGYDSTQQLHQQQFCKHA